LKSDLTIEEQITAQAADGSGVLVADNVCKRFEGAPAAALSNISLNVKAGEFYSFLGPSGCGKTTLLRIFAGFEEPSSGKILIDGKETVGVPPYKRPVNMVFQSYALFPHMSVLENVAFGLRAARKLNNAAIGESSREALKIVRLTQYADRLPVQLSGGQQQRVALARALVMRPVVLLLDEPLSALDVRIREEMQDELSRLKRELNLTFVMVTHDQSEALAISTRVAVFNQGILEQVGTPSEIYEHPRTAFTAGFIGRSNLLPGKVIAVNEAPNNSGQTIVLDCNGHIINCLATAASALKVGDSAYGCFKPEAVSLVNSDALAAQGSSGNADIDSSDIISLSCQIITSAYQGSQVDIKLLCSDFPDLSIRAIIPAGRMSQLSADKLCLQLRGADTSALARESV